MCGIAGICHVLWSETYSQPEQLLERMAATMDHRGPDGSGTYVSGTTGLAHRRLSIIDLAAGQQPMLSADENLAVVFNGEIFNYIELRDELKKRGRSFATESDTEVILHLYDEMGLDFVNELNGQFAIALWDNVRKRLVLARDRVGICPLFYTVDKGRLIFASEVKALRPALGSSLRISGEALDQIFTFWATVSPQTVFEGILEISPGTLLVLENGRYEVQRYWDWTFPDADFLDGPIAPLAEELRALLIDATRIRLRSDVPVGAYLSGGLDSSVLVTLIKRYGHVPLRSFSLTFDDERLDESEFQALLVDHLGADHSQMRVPAESVSADLVDTIRHTETPILRTAPVPMGLLSGLVHRSGYKVVLTGEGADEVLGGYDIFKEAKVRQFWARQPASQIRPLLLKKLYPYLNLPSSGAAAYLRRFFGEALDQPDLVYFSHIPRWATTAQAKKFFAPDMSDATSGRAIERLCATLPADLSRKHPFNRAQYLEAKFLMGGYLLSSQGDRMLMRNSVEGRFPYLDHRVIEFANRLSPKHKMFGLNEKHILKKAMGDQIPRQILERHKLPYRAPDISSLSSSTVSEEWRSYLTQERLADTGFFDHKKVSLLLRKAESPQGLSISESQAFTGILTTQVVDALYCRNTN
jgi:asparagine synthase (glutamine-hydrolysing)